MATKVLSAASRRRFLRRPWRNAGIGASNPFGLYMSKNFSQVKKLPFNKRASTLAKTFAELSPAARAKLDAEAKDNGRIRRAYRAKVKGTSAFGLFATENKELYASGFKQGARAVHTKWAALSEAKKAAYAQRAAKRNAAVERFIQANA